MAFRIFKFKLLLVFLLVAVLSTFHFTGSAQAAKANSQVYVVKNDRGGVVGERVAEIKMLVATGARVEITGGVCLSSCTMFLGVEDVCINPRTRFGFHGPSYYGKPLSPDRFEYWSNVIADYYPAAIRKWFLETGRYKINGYFEMEGAQLVRFGIQTC